MSSGAVLHPSTSVPAGGLAEDRVVLLDSFGRPAGSAPKSSVHHANTPLHLAFSCYVVDDHGRVLLTRRAANKLTWPATWTNACCGHPRPGEPIEDAARRRLSDELGLVPVRLEIALPDFAYRAEMADGTVEKELCPVLVAQVADEPRLNPVEAEGACWVNWAALVERARTTPDTLSPWSVRQIPLLAGLATSPLDWLAAQAPQPGTAAEPLELVTDPLQPITGEVNSVLAAFVAEREQELRGLHPDSGALVVAVRELLDAGGKRIRPSFVYWGYRATGAGHDPAVAVPAAAIELLHTFALIHDDVMDRAASRRGRPSTHRWFTGRHQEQALHGDAAWYGVSAAILAGDLAAAWADQLLGRAVVPAPAMAAAQRVFATLRAEVTAGQFLDLEVSAARSGGESEALQVALLKAGRYSVTRPLQLGAALAGGGPELVAALSSYGDAVGLAFQLRDDVLGLLGEPGVTGKGRLEDLREGKRTLLMLRALELAAPDDAGVLEAALGTPDLDDDAAARCREIVLDSGALASVETLVGALHARAIQSLAGVPQPAQAALRRLARLAAYRSQ